MPRTAVIAASILLLLSCNSIAKEQGSPVSPLAQTNVGFSGDTPGGLTDETLPLMRGITELYSADRANLRRFYDAPMSNLSGERQIQFLEAWKQTLDGIDFDALDKDGKIDHILLQNDVRYNLRSQEHEQKKHDEIDVFVPFAQVIIDLQEARRRVEKFEPREIADVVSKIPEKVESARESIEEKMKAAEGESPFNRSVANRAARMVDRLERTLSGWYRFHDGYDPLFTWWVAKPYENAQTSLKNETIRIRVACFWGKSVGRSKFNRRSLLSLFNSHPRSGGKRRTPQHARVGDDCLHPRAIDRDRQARVRVVPQGDASRLQRPRSRG